MAAATALQGPTRKSIRERALSRRYWGRGIGAVSPAYGAIEKVVQG